MKSNALYPIIIKRTIMKVLVFGSINIDRTFTLPRFLIQGETICSSSLSISAGGKGANQAVAIRKAGVETQLAATIGEDGIWIKDILSSFLVDTSLINVKKDTYTGSATILLDEKKCSSIILYGGANRENSTDYIMSVLSQYEKGDWIVLENEINNLDIIINEASDRGIKICLNPSPFEDNLFSLPLEKIDLLILNEVEMSLLLKREILDNIPSYKESIIQAGEKFPSADILLTLGDKGSIYKEKRSEKTIYTPALKTNCVDTTACGDTFLGYFLALSIKNVDLNKRLELATKASSFTATRPGAMESIPVINELDF